MTFAVGTKGQVTISKEIRDALGVSAGWRSIQNIENGKLILEFLPPKHRQSLKGILADATTVRLASTEELESHALSAWEQEAITRFTEVRQ